MKRVWENEKVFYIQNILLQNFCKYDLYRKYFFKGWYKSFAVADTWRLCVSAVKCIYRWQCAPDAAIQWSDTQ